MTSFTAVDQQLLAQLSDAAKASLLGTLQSNVPLQTVGVVAEFVGNGGITMTTATKVRNGLWDRQQGNGQVSGPGAGYDANTTVSLANGMVVSLNMVKTTKEYRNPRPSDGKKGNDYYLTWELSEDVGQQVAAYLEQFPLTPEAAAKQNGQRRSNNGGNRNFGGQQQSNGGFSTADIQALIQQGIAAALSQQQQQVPVQPQFDVPVPTVAPFQGHTVAAPIFSDVPAQPVVAEQDIPVMFPGQAVRCGLTGEVRYVSDQGIIRTNKTPSV